MSDPPRTDIRLGHEVDKTEHLPGALLLKRAAAEGLHEIHTANWPTSVKSLEAVGTPLARAISHGGESALYESGRRPLRGRALGLGRQCHRRGP